MQKEAVERGKQGKEKAKYFEQQKLFTNGAACNDNSKNYKNKNYNKNKHSNNIRSAALKRRCHEATKGLKWRTGLVVAAVVYIFICIYI